MPAVAHVHACMTWLLRSPSMGTLTLDRVGREGMADMAEERLPSAAGR